MRCSGFHNHIIGFSGSDTEFIYIDRLHRLSIGTDHGHFQLGNTHIEKRHGRSIDETQADFFIGLEMATPVLLRRFSIDQKGITGNIRQVGFQHTHLIPHLAVCPGGLEAVTFYLLKYIANGFALVLIIFGRFF